MNPYVIPPIVAGIAGAAIAVPPRIPSLLFELPAETPPAETMALYVQGGRFVTFVLVYGLLLGVAYWAGAHREEASADGMVALATGLAAALGHAVGIGAVILVIGVGLEGWLYTSVVTVGASVAVGVQLAVVAFAGVAFARRRGSDSGHGGAVAAR